METHTERKASSFFWKATSKEFMSDELGGFSIKIQIREKKGLLLSRELLSADFGTNLYRNACSYVGGWVGWGEPNNKL